MRIRDVFISLALVVSANTARAYTIIFHNEPDAFHALAGSVREIGFETLPDGSPTVDGTLITEAFNYYDQGVVFQSPLPTLFILGDSTAATLIANAPDSSAHNWIIAAFDPPVSAVGITFPGRVTLTLENEIGGPVVEVSSSAGGGFLGIIPDEPIWYARIDSNRHIEQLGSIEFTPVPEPSSLALLLLGGAAVIRRERGAR